MAIYDIYSNLDQEEASSLALDTFQKWMEFAMGNQAIGGRMLKRPSGRYASSIRYDDSHPGYIAIYADAGEAPEANFIEDGRQNATDLKEYMLGNGKGHRSKDGSLYRIIPIKNENEVIPTNPVITRTPYGWAGGSPFMWANENKMAFSSFNVHFRTMSSKQTGKWIIPPMAAYSPAMYLSQELNNSAGG